MENDISEEAKTSVIAQNVVYGVLQQAIARAYGAPNAFESTVAPATITVMHKDKRYEIGMKFVDHNYMFEPPIFGDNIRAIMKFVLDWARVLTPEIAREAMVDTHRAFKFGIDKATRGFIYEDGNYEMYYNQPLIGFYMISVD